MRVLHEEILSLDGSATANGDAISVEHLANAAIQAVWTGTPTGTIKVQASCDLAPTSASGNWSDLTGKTAAPAGAAGLSLIELVDMGYRWIRLVYTRSSGSGAIVARICGKGF